MHMICGILQTLDYVFFQKGRYEKTSTIIQLICFVYSLAGSNYAYYVDQEIAYQCLMTPTSTLCKNWDKYYFILWIFIEIHVFMLNTICHMLYLWRHWIHSATCKKRQKENRNITKQLEDFLAYH